MDLNSYFNTIRIIIGDITLVTLAIFALIEILHNKGIDLPWIANNLSKREKEKIDYIESKTIESISHIFEKDYNLFLQYKDDRIANFLAQLGLNNKYFEKVKFEIVRLRSLPIKDLSDIEKTLKNICTSELVLVNQTGSTSKVYTAVDYYINLSDIMFDDSFSHKIASMIKTLIEKNFSEEELSQINKIVVSIDGNYLLGLKVSELMKIPFVKMRTNPRVNRNQFWDGSLKSGDNIIFVHDVLVKADQIESSLRTFPNNVNVMGLFCLVHRTEWEGLKKLNDNGINLHSILKLCDADIKELVNNKGNN